MKIKASDRLFQILKELGVETVFCVTGGASAHMIESVRTSGLECIHFYHEQSCAMAADAYARIKKKPAVVLVTNGPGATNTITGVLGAFQDSLPVIVISGQVPRRQTIANSGANLRQYGVQEAEIISIVRSFTKSAIQINEIENFEKIIVNSYLTATSGRMGPVWLEIPLDIQAENLSESLNVSQLQAELSKKEISVNVAKYDEIISELKKSKRPIIVVGAGIHLANVESEFKNLMKILKIPVVCTWSATDLFNYNDEQYIGNFGLLGERAANLAIQNADFLLILGSRMSIPNVGYATELFSPKSFKVMVDIDLNEITKKSLNIDYPVVSDLKFFIKEFATSIIGFDFAAFTSWNLLVLDWKKRFIIFNEDHIRKSGKVNSYDFINLLSAKISNRDIVVTDMGTSFTCTMQSLRNNGENRLFTSSACCSMGFGLPGSLGAFFADKSKRVICIAGDGGFQMNIQELQAVIQNKVPLKIFILNSNGYLAISLMQDNLFNSNYIGSTPSSGVSAPSFSKIAAAYGIPSSCITSTAELNSLALDEILNSDSPYLCEILIPDNQLMIPRVQSTRDLDGKIMSGSIDNMYPFLTKEDADKIKLEISSI